MVNLSTRWSCVPLLLLSILVAPSVQQRDAVDIVFVLDGSDSVGAGGFETVKQSIINYITPQMGDGRVHAGFILYSTNLNGRVNLTPDIATFTAAVNALAYPGGETNTNIGLQWGLSVLMSTSTRPGTPQVMYVVVDGVSRFPDETASVAQFTRDLGTEVYAVGVGADVTQTELANIAGDVSRVFTTPSFAALPAISLQLDGGPVTVTQAPATTRPTVPPTVRPTVAPTTRPTIPPTVRPTVAPTTRPTIPPTVRPTVAPTTRPTIPPTVRPTVAPTTRPTIPPTVRPTVAPTTRPTIPPTVRPTNAPTTRPTVRPTNPPPTVRPTVAPTTRPTLPPVTMPTRPPVTRAPTTTPAPTTTRRAPTTPYVEPYLDDGLCDGSTIVSGVGYRAHPYESDKYVQCYFPRQGLALAIVRECPFGTLWNAHKRLCDPFHRVRLANDPCEKKKKELTSHAHEGNCRTFYNCEGGRSVPRCCPPGYLYNALIQACAPCNGCKDACPAMCDVQRFACNKYPVWDDRAVFRKWTKEGDVLVPCRNGTSFNLAACDCTEAVQPEVCAPALNLNFRGGQTGAAAGVVKFSSVETATGEVSTAFDGKDSRVSVRTTPQSPYDQPLVMRLTYREAEELRHPKALVSTQHCEHGGLLLVSLDRGQIKVEMSSYGRTPIIIRLPTAGFKTEDTKELLLIHDGDYLTVRASSGSLVYARRAEVAVLPYLNCGLDFGNSDWMDGFKGQFSRAQLLRCVPADAVSLK